MCLSGALAPPAPAPRERAMEPRVTLRVTCRGDTRTFLVSDPAHTTWADVEAMVSAGWPREAERGLSAAAGAGPGRCCPSREVSGAQCLRPLFPKRCRPFHRLLELVVHTAAILTSFS